MRTAYLKLCRLIAASGFRERDIIEFAEAVAQRHPRELMHDVSELRDLIGEVSKDRLFEPPSIGFSSHSSDVASRIERLLILDAGLPRVVAVQKMTQMLRERFPGIIVPPESRKGFRLWIKKLGILIPEKELLHLASSLRNRMVHEQPSDWRLK